jgi:hypothetical protein
MARQLVAIEGIEDTIGYDMAIRAKSYNVAKSWGRRTTEYMSEW